jgi:murein DD-endopeptidase MepM/ murein hydrolase activator NlpD
VILVPPRSGAPTRQVTLSTRTLATVGTVALAFVAAAATWTGETSRIAANTADGLAESQRTVVALLDSVATLRALAVRASHLPPRDMIMPVNGEITSGFSISRLHPILGIFRSHTGVDVSAPTGTHIVAPAPGRVRYTGYRFAYGLTIEVEHSGGIITRFAHCRSFLAKVGDQVNVGDAIATVGTSGLTTGPHVHFEVLRNGQPVDPIKFIATSRDSAAFERAHGEDR